MVVLTVSDQDVAIAATELARRLNPSVHVLTRVRRANMGADLKVRGANTVIADDFATGLRLTEETLLALSLSPEKISASMENLRRRAP